MTLDFVSFGTMNQNVPLSFICHSVSGCYSSRKRSEKIRSEIWGAALAIPEDEEAAFKPRDTGHSSGEANARNGVG